MRRWTILVTAIGLLACGSREREDAPERAPAADPIEIVRPPIIDDEPARVGVPAAPQTYEVLDALTRLLVPVPTEGDCALLAEDAPGAPLGEILATYVREADDREVTCAPALGGFRCRVSLVKSTAGDDGASEDDEWGVFVDLQMDASHAIEPASIVCHLAG